MARKKADASQTDIVDAANAAAAASALAAGAGAVTAQEAPAKARATVTEAFSGCRDGELHPREFKPGDEIEGELTAAMIAAGHAKPAKG